MPGLLPEEQQALFNIQIPYYPSLGVPSWILELNGKINGSNVLPEGQAQFTVISPANPVAGQSYPLSDYMTASAYSGSLFINSDDLVDLLENHLTLASPGITPLLLFVRNDLGLTFEDPSLSTPFEGTTVIEDAGQGAIVYDNIPTAEEATTENCEWFLFEGEWVCAVQDFISGGGARQGGGGIDGSINKQLDKPAPRDNVTEVSDGEIVSPSTVSELSDKIAHKAAQGQGGNGAGM